MTDHFSAPGNRHFINAAIMDKNEPSNAPWMVELDLSVSEAELGVGGMNRTDWAGANHELLGSRLLMTDSAA